MSLLLSGFKELNYGELLSVNGGSGSCEGFGLPIVPSYYFGCSGNTGSSSSSSGSYSGACSGGSHSYGSSISASLVCSGNADATNKLISIINDVSERTYTFGSWDCDIFVQTVLKDYGKDISGLWGDARSNDVAAHSRNLAGMTSSQPGSGWSVVMMTESSKYSINHCGLAYINSDGSVNFYNNTKSAGHVILEKYNSVAAFQRDFAYSKFDYYRLNI